MMSVIDVKKVIHEVTEYPEDYIQTDFHLESDLGIDSIKKIMIIQKLTAMLSSEMQELLSDQYTPNELLQVSTVGELQQIIDTVSEGDEETVEIASIEAAAASVLVGEVQEEIINSVAERVIDVRAVIHEVTEYPEDYIQMDFHLESDLGIDSIKRIMIIQKLTALLPKELQDRLSGQYTPNELLQVNTVQELQQIFCFSPANNAEILDFDEKRQNLLVRTILGKITGLDVHQIQTDSRLDIDLGIDSIKKVSFLNQILDSIEEDRISDVVKYVNIESLYSLETVGEYEMELEKFLNGDYPVERNRKLPLGNAQYLFLLSYWSSSTLSLVSKVELTGDCDLERLTRAWRILVNKQPSLQSYFQCDEDAKKISEYRLCLRQGQFDYQIPVYDITHLNKINQDACMDDFSEKIINSRFDIFSFPLHQFYIFQLEQDKFTLMLAANHLIADGLGMQKILRDMVCIYDELMSNSYSEAEDQVKTISVEQYKAEVQQSLEEISAKEGEISKSEKYWFPVSKKTGAGRMGEIASDINTLSKADTIRLKGAAENFGVSLYSVIVSAYLLAIQSIDQKTEFVTLNLPTSGNIGSDFDLTDIIGCFAQNLSLTFERYIGNADQYQDYIQYVQNKINTSLLNQEDLVQGRIVEKNALVQEILEKRQVIESVAGFIAGTVKTNVFLSYIGDAKYKENYKNLQVTGYDIYTATNKDTIDILVEIVHNKLLFSINYDRNAYEKEDIKQLYDRIKLYLMEFILMSQQVSQRDVQKGLADVPITEIWGYDNGIATVVESIIGEVSGVAHIDRDKPVEFVYGISSIEKMKILTKILERYEVRDKVKLFQFQTVNELIHLIQGNQKSEQPQQQKRYDCAPAQKWILKYFQGDCKWGGYSRFTYKGKLDTKIMEKAFKMLIKQNDALRMHFEQTEGITKLIFEEDSPIDIKYMTLQRQVDNQVLKSNIQKLMHEELMGFDILKLPLVKVRVIVLPDGNEQKYEFILLANHTILDMVSNNILFGKMWENYLGLLSDDDLEVQVVDSSFADYAEAASMHYQQNGVEYREYWTKEYEYFKPTMLPSYKAGATNYEKDEQTVERILSEAKTKALQQFHPIYKAASFYHVLLEPLYRLLSELSGEKRVAVSHRSHGRILGNKTYMDIVGNFAVNFPVALAVDSESREELIEKISRKFSEIPLNGVSYDLVGDDLESAIYPDHKVTTIRSNYLGNIDDISLPAAFEYDQEQMNQRLGIENQERISEIEFFFAIAANRLQIKIAYPAKKYDTREVEKLLDQYYEYLEYFIREPHVALDHQNVSKTRNKVAVVTGGSKGIGKAIAEKYLSKGYDTVLIARNVRHLELCQKELEQKYPQNSVLIYPTDILDYAGIEKVKEVVCQRYQVIDTLVCCAGVTLMKEMTMCSPEEWMNIVQTNICGTFNTLHHFIPIFRKQKSGSIAVIGSDSSYIGYPMMTAYAASKHGLVGLVRCLSEEVKQYGVTINLICPTLVDTDMAPPSMRKNALKKEEVADVVYQYTRKEMRTITGTVVKVNGKRDMYWFGSEKLQNLNSLLDMQ